MHCAKLILKVTFQKFRQLWQHSMHLNFRLQRQGKEMNLRALVSIFMEEKAAQVGFEPTTSCFQGSRSTN